MAGNARAALLAATLLAVPASGQLVDAMMPGTAEQAVKPESEARVAEFAERLGLELHDRAYWGAARNEQLDAMHPSPGDSNNWTGFVMTLQSVASTVDAVGVTRLGPGETILFGESEIESRHYGETLMSSWAAERERFTDRQLEDAEKVFEVLDETFDPAVFLRMIDDRNRPATDSVLTVDFLLPYLSTSRRSARALRAWSAWLLENGQEEDAVEALGSGLAVARIVSGDPWILNQLVGIAIRSMFLNEITRHAAAGRLSPDAAETLGEILDETALPAPAVSMHAESLLVRSELDNQFRIAIGRMPAGADPKPLMETYLTFSMQAPHAEQAEAVDRFYEGAGRAFELPLTAQGDALAALPGAGRRHLLLSTMRPAIGKIGSAYARLRTTEAGARAALAIVTHHERTGAWPEAMDQLEPGDAGASFTDGMTGEPLRYRLVNAEAPTLGRASVLYSVGTDLTDDGGDLEADLVFVGPNSGDESQRSRIHP